MTEEKLLQALNKAKSKNQIGILIWANWSVWDEHSFDMKVGNPIYDEVLSQLNKGISSTNYVIFMGLKMPGFFAISVKEMLLSKELFDDVLNACNKGLYNGPISLLPLNETLEV